MAEQGAGGVEAEMAALAARISDADLAYHQADAPVMSDADYDALKARLRALEDEHPDFVLPDSPTARIGAVPAAGFRKVALVTEVEQPQ